MYSTMFNILLGFIGSNFLFQAITGRGDWYVAFERSYFQAAIVIVIALYFALQEHRNN